MSEHQTSPEDRKKAYIEGVSKEPRATVVRNVKFHAQGEYLLIRLVRGEQVSPGGIIQVDSEKADLQTGVVQSIGDKAKKPEYGPPIEVGQLVMFAAKNGVKIDRERKIIAIDEVFLASDIETADTEPAPATEPVQ